jgi:hypothetical protein
MSLPSASRPASGLHDGGSTAAPPRQPAHRKGSKKTQRPPHPFIARFKSHPALPLARPDHEFLAHLTAHPAYCLASQASVRRWEAKFDCRAASQIPAQQWQVSAIGVGPRQLRALLTRSALCELLVLRLTSFRGDCPALIMGTSILVHWGEDAARFRDPLRIAMSIVSRRHFLGSYKDEAEGMFEEGQRLYGEQRFSEAAERWGRAALLQHAPSHAHLSNMLQEGRPGLPSDHPRSFQLASAGAAMGCAHSIGVLSQCLVTGVGVAVDRAQGLALARRSAAAGSVYGQFVVGLCTHVGWEVARDHSEAARLCVAYLPPPPLPVLL